MPGLIHRSLIAVLRRFPLPDPMGLGLRKNIVVRQPPTKRQLTRHRISLSKFDGHTIYTFDKPQNGEPILYFCHGGGYIAGMFSAYYDGVGRLQRILGHPVICPDYPMPPETNAEGVRDFALAHFRQVLADYPDSPLVIAGDSAGGHLTLILSQALGSDERARVKAIFPLFPVADMRQETGAAMVFHPEEVLLREETMPGIRDRFAGDYDRTNPVISPILGDLKNLPPTHIYSADRDPLNPNAVALKAAMDAIGAEATHHIFEGYGHDFCLFFPTPDGRRELRRIGDHIRACLTA